VITNAEGEKVKGYFGKKDGSCIFGRRIRVIIVAGPYSEFFRGFILKK
jgi:hypothetical protein